MFVFWIGQIRKALRAEFEARAAALDITASQLLVLRRLWQGDGELTSVIAREAGCDGATTTGMLDRLEAKGLIRRQRCQDDRRAVRVFLTREGKSLEQPLTEILTEINEQALAGMSQAERDQLVRLLTKVGENLGA